MDADQRFPLVKLADNNAGYRHEDHLNACRRTRQRIADALAEDARCRVPGVTEGTYGIADLAPFARLGHGAPTIRMRDWYSGERYNGAAHRVFHRAADDAEFRRRFGVAAPDLATFDLRRYGLCAAGGAMSALLMRSDKFWNERESLSDGKKEHVYAPAYHDIDLFLVGHASDGAALGAIDALRRHLYERGWRSDQGGQVYRSKGCFTFFRNGPADLPKYARDVPIQVILRRYSTAAEVIHGFDLGSSAALWDGERFLTTAMGKIAFESGANVLNLDARRNSFERRIARYAGRGFDLVVPGLDACALASLEGRLPYLKVAGVETRGCSCCIVARELYATRPDRDDYGRRIEAEAEAEAEPSWARSGEEPKPAGPKPAGPEPAPEATSDYAMGDIAYGNERSLAARNIRALTRQPVWLDSLVASAPLTLEVDLWAIEPTADPALLASLVEYHLGGSSGRVNLRALRAILGDTHTAALMLTYLEGGRPPAPEAIRRRCIEYCRAINANAHIPFAFMTVEDRTALTGPFPRAVLTLREWLGGAGSLL